MAGTGLLQETAEIVDISGDFSGPFATDDLEIVDEISAISMTENDQRQTQEELENL